MFTTDVHELMLVYESMKSMSKVSKVIIVNSNKVLLLQKNGSLKWELPGGHLEKKETFKQAIKRETREETGIKLNVDMLNKIQTTHDTSHIQRIYSYTEPVKYKPNLSDEHVDFAWVSKDKLDKYTLTTSTNHLAILSVLN